MSGKLRVASAYYISALPFSLLKDLDFVVYEEHSSHANGQKLHDGLVDVALIPVSEFAMGGNYVGLDFGICASPDSKTIILCSNSLLSELDTIYVQDGICASVWLTQLIYRERGWPTPKLIRDEVEYRRRVLTEREGILFVSENQSNFNPNFRYYEDLTATWFDMTGKPFVFSVWAARPESLTRSEYSMINEVLHKGVSVKESLAKEWASENNFDITIASKLVSKVMSYYLEDSTIESLNEFFRRCYSWGLLPSCKYQGAAAQLLSQEPVNKRRINSVDLVGKELLKGGRLGISEGCILGKDSIISELLLLSDVVSVKRGRVLTKDSLVISEFQYDSNLIKENIVELNEYLSFESLCNKINEVSKNNGHVAIKDLSALSYILASVDDSINNFVLNLRSNGLSKIYFEVDKVFIRHRMPTLKNGQEILSGSKALAVTTQSNIIDIAHACGIKTVGIITVDLDTDWEYFLSLLNRMRRLQDDNPGIIECKIEFLRLSDTITQARYTAVANIFLDNMPVTVEY